MPASIPARLAATALALTLTFQALAAETDGDWNCTQAADTGKWSCARDGVSAADLAGAGTAVTAATSAAPATDPATTDSSPAQIDPYEARARAAVERVDAPAPAESPVLVDEPVNADPVAETESPQAPATVQEDVPERVPEPRSDASVASEPVPAAAPADSGTLPDYQRLAYVPEKPTSLLELPAEFWVAQLMAVSSKEFLESYAEEHNLRGLSAARIASGERLFFVLILGIYDTKAKAEQAIGNLPPPYHRYKPLLRTLGSLQQAMRKADELTGSSDF